MLSITTICVCVKILVNVKAYMYSMCTPCTWIDKYLLEWKIFWREVTWPKAS